MKASEFVIRTCSVLILIPLQLLSQPKLNVVGGTKFSFGNIYTSTKVQKTISIRNEGNDTLRITDVSATCGCTAAMISTPHIAPRDSGSLSITFDASRFNGWVDKGVSFRSNDPSHPSVSIAFSANIMKVFEIDPEYVMFSHAKVDSEFSQEVTIKNISPKEIHILTVTTSSDILSTQLSSKSVEPNQEATLQCALRPRKAGSYNGNIEIKTDHPQVPVYNIRFFAFVKENNSSKSPKQ